MPIVLANQTSKTVSIKKGEDVGRALSLSTIQVKLDERENRCLQQVGGIEDKEIEAADRHKARVGGLLRSNCCVVAKSDKYLGQTNPVKIKIDTGDPPTTTTTN